MQTSLLKSIRTETTLMNSLSVWLIDDDPIQNRINTRTIKRSLAECEVTTYSDSREALSILKNQDEKPKLIFIDLNMPHIGGIEFIKEVSQLDLDIPFIILSTAVDHTIEEFASEYSFVKKCIKKPLFSSDVAFLKSTPF